MIFQSLSQEKEKKNMLSEPVETLIVRAQQNFDVAGGLKPNSSSNNRRHRIKFTKKI